MTRRRKIAAIVASIPLLVVLAGISLFLVYNWMAVREAEHLLQEVRALKLGESTSADVDRIMQRFSYWQGKLRFQTNCKSCVVLGPSGYPSAQWLLTVTEKMGVSPWWIVYASFSEREGRLSGVSYHVFATEMYRDALGVGAEAVHSYRSNEPDLPNYSLRLSEPQKSPHYINLRARATEEASPQELGRMFDFSFSCLKWLGWCRTPCELMPAAWSDYLAIRRSEGNPLSPEAAEYYCPGRSD